MSLIDGAAEYSSYDYGTDTEDIMPSAYQHSEVSVCRLVMVGFFWVNAGLYGNEAILEALPPLYAFLGILLVPLIHSMPMAFIQAELSTATREESQQFVVWINDACGNAIGTQNAYWVWVIHTVDSAVYPVLAAAYFGYVLNLSYLQERFIAFGIVIVTTIFRLLGKNLMSCQNILALLSLAPSFIYIVSGVRFLKPERWIVVDNPKNWALGISWILWLYSGMFSLGELATQVIQGPNEKKGRRKFVTTVIIIGIVIALFNFIPLAIAISIDDDRTKYEPGHFTQLSEKAAGAWMKWFFTVGSAICLVGLYNYQILPAERTAMYFVKKYLPRLFSTSPVTQQSSSLLYQCCFSRMNSGAGDITPFFVIFNALIIIGLTCLKYSTLVEIEMLMSSICTILFFYTYIYFRWKKPTLHRPFRIPGRICSSITISIIPIIISLFNIYFVLVDEEQTFDKIRFFKVWAFLLIILIGVIGHILGRLLDCGCPQTEDYSNIRGYPLDSNSDGNRVARI